MASQESINKPEWDYSSQARYYSRRPNYSKKAIQMLCDHVRARTDADFVVADIGAGTGNLSLLLKDKVGNIVAVEPNREMRERGIANTANVRNVRWIVGTGENTTLRERSVDLTAFGSSFNTTDRQSSLIESHRILKDNGFFACMWNNRDLTVQTQRRVEEIIKRYYPAYSHGTRREQQADTILSSKLFNHLYYYEVPEDVEMGLEDYCDGWRSVKNQFWDLSTNQGKETLERIISDIQTEFSGTRMMRLVYVTRVWIARKQN